MVATYSGPGWRPSVGRPPGGKEGPYIQFGRVLRDRRETMAGLAYRERSQTAMADRLGVSQSYLGRLERGQENLPNYDLSWFEKNAPHYGWAVEEMLDALNIDFVKSARPRESRLTPELQAARDKAVQDFLAEVKPGMNTSVWNSGTGPAWTDENPDTWIIEDPEIFKKFPNMVTYRITGSSMEPYYRDGDIVYVVPDREAIGAGKMVLVWLSDNGRVVKHLIHEDEDGAHLLQQSNPRTQFFAPAGSTVLGAVVGKRQIGAPKLSTKELYEAIAEHMPHLLEDEPI